MPTLTDIVATSGSGGGVQLGDYLYARPEHLGLSGNIGSQQFVRTGFLVPFESRHAPLISLTKSFGVVSGNASHLLGNNWLQRVSVNQAAIRHTNGRYYAIETAIVQSTWGAPSQNVAYGNTYINGTNASAGIAGAFSSGSTVGIGDSLEFNNGINVIGYTGSNPHGMEIWRINSAGTGFTSVYTNGNIHSGSYGGCLANSSSNVCAWPAGFVTTSCTTPHIATSNDGITWTGRTPTVNGTSLGFDSNNINLTRLAFSSIANSYIITSTNASHYFVSTNGYELTRINPPIGYGAPPFSGAAPSSSAYGFYANSPTVTIIPIGSGKVLRITGNPVTDPTAHSIVDIGKGGYNAAMFNVVWTGSEFVAFPYVTGGLAWCQMFTSPDGLEWTPNHTYAAAYARDSRDIPPIGQPFINQQIFTVSQANGRTFIQSTGVLNWPIYDVTGRIGVNSVPDYVGVPVALSFASGSSLVPYLRVT
jgi:hypothetical protein